MWLTRATSVKCQHLLCTEGPPDPRAWPFEMHFPEEASLSGTPLPLAPRIHRCPHQGRCAGRTKAKIKVSRERTKVGAKGSKRMLPTTVALTEALKLLCDPFLTQFPPVSPFQSLTHPPFKYSPAVTPGRLRLPFSWTREAAISWPSTVSCWLMSPLRPRHLPRVTQRAGSRGPL